MSVSMTVTWKPSQHVTTVGYTLQYRPKGATVWISATTTPMPQTSQVVTGLVADTLYEFRCIATVSAWTDISLASELRTGMPPNPPTNLKVSA
jgi:hypothetical protein